MSIRKKVVLLVVFVAQLAVPISMIRTAESTIREGHTFRFETVPVDPVDLFHGRYVALQFSATHAPAIDDEPLEYGSRAYARIIEDEDGFAQISGVQRHKPDDPNYLTVRIEGTNEGRTQFGFPVNRFYMEEHIAPVAEQVYRERRPGRTWARIRVREGHAVIEDVLIDSVSLREAAARERATATP